MSGTIKVVGRWGFPPRSQRKKYSKKYFYWYLVCTDENTLEEVSCAPTYKELSKVLEDIITHEIKYYTKTLGIVEARKRYRQLADAMLKSIMAEEERLDCKGTKSSRGEADENRDKNKNRVGCK